MHLLGLLNFTHLVATAGYGAVFLLCVLQSCCVPTSSELTLGFAGALAAQGKLSLAGVVAAGVLGEVVGAYVAWALGRYLGRAVVDRYGRYLLLSHRDLDRAEAWYDRHQRFGVFGSRLLPVIRNFVALPAGIAEVPLLRFGVLTAGGSLLWDGAWAGIGYGVGAHWHAIAKAFGDIGYVLGALVVVAVAFGAFHRYQSYQAALADEQGGGPAAAPGPGRLDDAGRHAYKTGPGGPTRPLVRGNGSLEETGTVRWIASSSGRPPPVSPSLADGAGTATATVAGTRAGTATASRRLIASSSGRVVATPRHAAFPNSPIAAWEAAVLHGKREAHPSVDPLLEEDKGVEANGRLTAMLGALLLVLLAVEGISILRITTLLTLHVVVGMVLVPVVLLKIGSTTWRFAKYYLGSPAYRRKGPPPAALRLLGPFVVVSTIAVVGSGIALLLAPSSLRTGLLLVHKVTFVLWFAAMIIHVLGHLLDVAHLAPRDFYRRTRRQIRGAGLREWAIVTAVGIGIVLAVAVAPKVGPWLAGLRSAHNPVHLHAIAPVNPTHRQP